MSNDRQTCGFCGDPAIVHVHIAHHRKWSQIHHACEEHADEILVRHFSSDPDGPAADGPFDSTVPFDIELLVMRSDGPHNGVYYLQQAGRARRFCSTMGYCESASLYSCLSVQGSATPRRSTYATFAHVLSLLGGVVQDVEIFEFNEQENCFHALVRIVKGNDLAEVDVRPSDAINLALACNAPIFVSEEAWRVDPINYSSKH